MGQKGGAQFSHRQSVRTRYSLQRGADAQKKSVGDGNVFFSGLWLENYSLQRGAGAQKKSVGDGNVFFSLGCGLKTFGWSFDWVLSRVEVTRTSH